MDIHGYITAMSRVFESNDDYEPDCSKICFEDWMLFPFDRASLVEKYAVKTLDQVAGSDVERIANHDPAIVLAGQKEYKNHSYKIYFDGAFGGINRHILTIDDQWAQVESNFSSLMAFADYVAERHDKDVQKLQGEDVLQISWFNESCLNCRNC